MAFSWLSTPFRFAGKLVGFDSDREVLYAVFGKQLQQRRWLIAIHLIDTSKVAYESLVQKLKENDYVELCHPKTDIIRGDGDVSIRIQCCCPWLIRLGKSEIRISAGRILQGGIHYHEVMVEEDKICSADLLELTIEAVSLTEEGEVIGHPVRFVVSYPLQLEPTVPTSIGTQGTLYFVNVMLRSTYETAIVVVCCLRICTL